MSDGWIYLDLHGVLHEDADFIIEKFVTDHFDHLPVKIITGYSKFFVDKVKEYSEKYELECCQETWYNYGCWIVYETNRPKVLDR